MSEEAGEEVAVVSSHMEMVLKIVAEHKGMSGVKADAWVRDVRDKLTDVGVDTPQDLIRNILLLNGMLLESGHQRLHHTTLESILHETCETLFDVTPEEMAEMAVMA